MVAVSYRLRPWPTGLRSDPGPPQPSNCRSLSTVSTVALMASQEKRFEVIHEQKSFAEVTRVLVDHETGVCYLQTWAGTSGGLTVLVNPDGSPVVQQG